MQNKVFLAIFRPYKCKILGPCAAFALRESATTIQCTNKSPTSLAAECSCERKSNVVGREGKVFVYCKKEFPLNFCWCICKVENSLKSLCGVKHSLNHWKNVSWEGKKWIGNPRGLHTNKCLMIFREMLDSLEGWESAWSAPLDNITGTQTHPHTMSLQKAVSV